MLTVDTIAAFLEQFAPRALAEDWDNVGLLVGDRHHPVERIMTCLTVTPESAEEAIDCGADLIVTHHPLPFRPLTRLTRDHVEGRLLLDLIAAKIAVYSPHTAFDSARTGINQQWAEGLGLSEIGPLVPGEDGLGTGRWGSFHEPMALEELVKRVKKFLAIEGLHVVGAPDQIIRTVAVACGSAGEMLTAATEQGCDALVLGETRFHTCLQAEATGVALVLAGHFASERFAVEQLAGVLGAQFPEAKTWVSEKETDPIRWG